MDVQKIQNKINNLHYWDSRVLRLSCDYFADEVTLIYEDSSGNVNYNFYACYKVNFIHNLKFDKVLPSKQLSFSQIPYFLQDVSISDYKHDNVDFYKCVINMEPMTVEILCKDIQVSKDEK